MGRHHHHAGESHEHLDGADGRSHCDQPAADCAGNEIRVARSRKERASLAWALAVTGVVFFAELIGGFLSGSLALQADAGHMFADVIALGIAMAGIVIAARPVDERRTWGYHRLEVLSALANGVLLVAVAAIILHEAWERYHAPTPIELRTMLGVAVLGLGANLVAVSMLVKNRGSIALKGAFLHALGDTVSSVGVIIGAVVMVRTGWWGVDAAISAGIAVLIAVNAWGLIREATAVLLEAIPRGMEVEKVRDAIAGIRGVRDVHDIHISTITSGMFAFSCHVAVETGIDDARRDAILTEAKTVLHDRFGIDHSTIQVEGAAFREIGLVH